MQRGCPRNTYDIHGIQVIRIKTISLSTIIHILCVRILRYRCRICHRILSFSLSINPISIRHFFFPSVISSLVILYFKPVFPLIAIFDQGNICISISILILDPCFFIHLIPCFSCGRIGRILPCRSCRYGKSQRQKTRQNGCYTFLLHLVILFLFLCIYFHTRLSLSLQCKTRSHSIECSGNRCTKIRCIYSYNIRFIIS